MIKDEFVMQNSIKNIEYNRFIFQKKVKIFMKIKKKCPLFLHIFIMYTYNIRNFNVTENFTNSINDVS